MQVVSSLRPCAREYLLQSPQGIPSKMRPLNEHSPGVAWCESARVLHLVVYTSGLQDSCSVVQLATCACRSIHVIIHLALAKISVQAVETKRLVLLGLGLLGLLLGGRGNGLDGWVLVLGSDLDGALGLGPGVRECA